LSSPHSSSSIDRAVCAERGEPFFRPGRDPPFSCCCYGCCSCEIMMMATITRENRLAAIVSRPNCFKKNMSFFFFGHYTYDVSPQMKRDA
jgi:hypothetical protein